MNISKLASTVILATAFATLFVFAFLFYLYGDLKDALSDTASFFGGIATLVAAYIATQLFNDWREQHNKQIMNTFGLKVYEKYLKFEDALYSAQDTLSDLKVEIEKDSSTGNFYFGEAALKKYQNHIFPCFEKLDLINGDFNFF